MASGFLHRHLLFTCAGIALLSGGQALAAENESSVAGNESSAVDDQSRQEGVGSASASTDDSNVILVTAQGRAESLQDVPLSIFAVTSDDLEKKAIKELTDLNVPSLNLSYNLRMTVAMRGISTGYNSSFDQSVPLFLDKVYFGRSVMAQIGLFDVDRVEVLRGPQPIFFGKNAIAGAISVVTKRPSFDVEANASVGYEFEANEQVYQGGVTVPASDSLAFRFAGSYRKMDGWLKNNFLGGAGPHQREANFRVGALWEPTSNLSVYAKYDNFSRDTYGDAYEAYNCGTLPPGYIDLAHDDCELNGVSSSANEPRLFPNLDRGSVRGGFDKFRIDGGMVEANYGFLDGYNLEITAAHYRARTSAITERGGTEFNWSDTNPQERYSVSSIDTRITSPTEDRLSWLLGVFVDWDKDALNYPALAYACGDPRYATCATAHNASVFHTQALTKSNSWSVYGQASYQIVDPLTLVLAARYSEVDKTVPYARFSSQTAVYDPATGGMTYLGVPAFSLQAIDLKRSDKRFQPAVTLEYRPMDDAMFFVSYKEGFKAGGFDVEAFSPPPFGDLAFDPEYVKTYEAGMRLEFLDRRARLNITGFRSDYTNLQVASFNTLAEAGFFTQNAASQRSQGIELEASFFPLSGLELGVNGAYLDSQYRSFTGGTCYLAQTPANGCVGGRQDLSGHSTIYAPEWSGNLFASFTTDMGSVGGTPLQFEAFANLYLTDDYLVDAREGPFATQPSYERFDATVSVKTADDRWKLSLIGRNLNDALVYDGRNETSRTGGQLYTAILRRARQVMLQLSFQY